MIDVQVSALRSLEKNAAALDACFLKLLGYISCVRPEPLPIGEVFVFDLR